jgi:RNA polymerase sigma-70 factor (ECF subfamily)
MTRTDEELVALSMGGDKDSFNQLILRWERPIYALAYRVIGREEDARDVVQETFLRAFRALPGFKGQAKFSSWLYRIALNLCRDWIRRQRRAPVMQPPEGVASSVPWWRRRWNCCPRSSAPPSCSRSTTG